MIILQSTATSLAERPVIYPKSAALMSFCPSWLPICVLSVRICGSLLVFAFQISIKVDSSAIKVNHACSSRIKTSPWGPQKRPTTAAEKSQTIVFGQFTKNRHSKTNPEHSRKKTCFCIIKNTLSRCQINATLITKCRK